MGPLNGYTVIELAGIGPAPMGGMILADMGAEVIRIDRASGANALVMKDVSTRGKKSVVLNLKEPAGIETLLRMVENADALIDPYRPGVCEKLGIGPDVCLERNPKLVFARMTGWGQEGPLAHAAGHDINYIAITGALYAMGRKGEKPVPPLNLVGDMGGGGMLLVNGVLAALLEAANSGTGQVIDVAMVDGAAQLMWMFHGFQHIGMWDVTERESNLLDGGAHFYDTYECSDGEYVAIGSIEPQFYALLKELAGLSEEDFGDQNDQAKWPAADHRVAHHRPAADGHAPIGITQCLVLHGEHGGNLQVGKSLHRYPGIVFQQQSRRYAVLAQQAQRVQPVLDRILEHRPGEMDGNGVIPHRPITGHLPPCAFAGNWSPLTRPGCGRPALPGTARDRPPGPGRRYWCRLPGRPRRR